MMAHKNNMVVAIVVDGKIMREIDGNVYLPPNTEYKIRLKNLSSKKCVVDVSIDGRSIGARVIVPSNDTVDLERFDIDNSSSGNKFMFIKKTDEVSKYHGDTIDDGIICIEYQFEIDMPPKRPIMRNDPPWFVPHDYNPYWIDNSDVSMRSVTSTSAYNASIDSKIDPNTIEDGRTVEGSHSDQTFVYGHTRELENQSHVITIQLKCGEKTKVKTPITVKTTIQCRGCGKFCKSSCKYCPNCGTKIIY